MIIICFNPHTHTGCDEASECHSATLRLFQSTHPYRVWRNIISTCWMRSRFQSTHPYRVWPMSSFLAVERVVFQSTHPYRVWLKDSERTWSLTAFQSTHPYRVWREAVSGWRWCGRCFNPHTHTGCDYTIGCSYDCQRVSIHTPIQGVTWDGSRGNQGHRVSIHTPIQGVTSTFVLFPFWVWVSIHTPIQGVTVLHLCQDAGDLGFNPHTHTGCDWLSRTKPRRPHSFNPHTHTGCDRQQLPPPANRWFQSTHPYRVWHTYQPYIYMLWCFNPHTHTGCDFILDCSSLGWLCFNPHTHTGCDIQWSRILSTYNVSIHTPIQGVTILGECGLGDVCKFQSTHPYRVWLNTLTKGKRTGKFQSTHPYRVWQRTLMRKLRHPSFNPHTHTGCDAIGATLPCCWSVSIHTPIQGVTSRSCSVLRAFRCFNPHTHTGCDLYLCGQNWCLTSFNPHTHTGCDWPQSRCSRTGEVSIHTPIQGVTQPPLEFHLFKISFNPHTHTGCDAFFLSSSDR